MSNGQKWTQEEIDFLISDYPTIGNKACAVILERTPASIERKVQKLGIKHKSSVRKDNYPKELIDMGITEIKPLETYICARTPILHEHSCGHKWKARPDNIFQGKNCPKCAHGFKRDRPAILYCVSFKIDNVTIYKLGVTNRTVKARYGGEWNKLKMLVEWETTYDSGEEAYNKEQELLEQYKLYKQNTGALRAGNTETFLVMPKIQP